MTSSIHSLDVACNAAGLDHQDALESVLSEAAHRLPPVKRAPVSDSLRSRFLTWLNGIAKRQGDVIER